MCSGLIRKLQNGNSLSMVGFYLLINVFSAVFTWTNLLVVVAELDGNENEALDLVPLVTNVVLEVRYQLFCFPINKNSFF